MTDETDKKVLYKNKDTGKMESTSVSNVAKLLMGKMLFEEQIISHIMDKHSAKLQKILSGKIVKRIQNKKNELII